MHQPLTHNDICIIQEPHTEKECELLGRDFEDIDFKNLPPWARRFAIVGCSLLIVLFVGLLVALVMNL